MFGEVILPGTAFVELGLLAAQRVGLDGIEELTLEAPLGLTFTDDERKDRDRGYLRVRAELEGRPGAGTVGAGAQRSVG